MTTPGGTSKVEQISFLLAQAHENIASAKRIADQEMLAFFFKPDLPDTGVYLGQASETPDEEWESSDWESSDES